ncbi:hypothetical protein ST47_g4988 [Ascochyta rabiei]|uniref:Uncharacterized protein n=1 Tax=Didymella rabiei TaxID=5454 RepID=A0A163ESS5_DIDRA|nr:hypothetical protein ST47_g4988 [Ascochyta rabiei]
MGELELDLDLCWQAGRNDLNTSTLLSTPRSTLHAPRLTPHALPFHRDYAGSCRARSLFVRRRLHRRRRRPCSARSLHRPPSPAALKRETLGFKLDKPV